MKTILAIALCLALFATPLNAGRGFAGTDLIVANGIGSPLDISSGPMTISLWFYATAVDGVEHDIASHWQGITSGAQWIVGIGTSCSGCTATGLNFFVGCCSAISGTYGSCGLAPSNSWHNAIIIVDSAGKYTGGTPSANFLLDNAGCANQAYIEHRTAGGANVNIGGHNGTANFKGRVAEFGIWNDILNSSELKSLAAGVSPSRVRRSKLVGYFPLYGASGVTIEPDQSGNLDNGTLTGTTIVPQCPCGSPAGNP